MLKAILTLTGPTCSGKSTVERVLREKHGFQAGVSMTTRARREGEVHGKHYYFVTPEQMRNAIKSGELIDHVEFSGAQYGMQRSEADKAFAVHKPFIVVCEPIGQKQIRAYCEANNIHCYGVFLDVPWICRFDRFLERFERGEMERQSAAVRLATMATTEKAWILEAFTGDCVVPPRGKETQKRRHIYDTIVMPTPEDMPEQVARTIFDRFLMSDPRQKSA